MDRVTADELVAAAPLPDGWSLEAEELRRYKYRSLWRLTARYRGAGRLRWDVYRVAAALPAIVERIAEEAAIEAQRVVVTTDGAGWVRDIQEGAA